MLFAFISTAFTSLPILHSVSLINVFNFLGHPGLPTTSHFDLPLNKVSKQASVDVVSGMCQENGREAYTAFVKKKVKGVTPFGTPLIFKRCNL